MPAPVAVALPDGSTVTLNSGSALRRTRGFGRMGSAREVRLVGEAYFSVARSRAPFVVRTAGARVTVLGTRFGVRTWGEDGGREDGAREDGGREDGGREGATVVALLSGRVVLAPEGDAGAAVVLAPGEVGRIARGAPVAVRGGVEEALAWRAGDLVYKDRPLAVVLGDVERRFGVVVVADAALGRRRVSVALRRPASAEAVVRDLATAFGLRYSRRADGFELHAAGVAL